MIYKRFTEKSAEEWRQIYKALQLMEFLIKNGSERVIDDARSHLSLLKMLKQFHYIDQNGKDQGLNVRNRSKELVDLLSDVERIRSERKKSRTTRNKYGGVEGGIGASSGSSGRYGGFGSESAEYGASSYGGTSRAVYGDGGGFGGEGQDEYEESGRAGGADRFEEYDEFDDGGAQAQPTRRKPGASTRRTSGTSAKKPKPAAPKEPEVDLFDFGDEPASAPSNGTSSTILAAPPSSVPAGDDDDFDDFQSATPSGTTATPAVAAPPSISQPNYSSFSTATPSSATHFAQPVAQSSAQNANFHNLLSTTSPPPSSTGTPSAVSAFSPPSQARPAQPTGYQPTGPNYFTSVQVQPTPTAGAPGSSVTSPAAGSQPGKKAGGDAFASLLSGSGVKKTNSPAQKGLTMADMAKMKSQQGLYGANAAPIPGQPPAGSAPKKSTGSSGLDDLLG